MTAQAEVQRSRPLGSTLIRIFREQPIMPLLGLLVVLVAAFAVLNPRADFSGYLAAQMRTAIPLAILAGCQTLTMLTGGIDLSVATMASMAGFVAATLVTPARTACGLPSSSRSPLAAVVGP